MKTTHELVERLMQEAGSKTASNPKVLCYIGKHSGVFEIMSLNTAIVNNKTSSEPAERVIVLMLAQSTLSVSL